MKLKPSTLFFVLAALLLGGVVLVVQSQSPPAQEAQQSEPQNLFAFQEGQVKTLTLQTQLRSLKFERDKDGKWQMLEPDKVPASDASIAFLLNQVATGKSQRSFTVKGGEREEYSFHQPLATIEVTLNNQETHKLILGGYDFNRSNLYALADPPADSQADLKVLLVSPNFENAVSRPLADWKATAASPSPASPDAPSPASPDAAAPPSPAPSATVSPAESPSPESAAPAASPNAAPTAPAE
ncbi:DUF4340 domain-containing protein [Phormidium tenue FACHB-886]|nr:DUF4340 domain-containing protein [Phormidium tenue FACHB-886]